VAVTALPARDELLIPKISKLLVVRILEGELPDPGDPDVVSIWRVGEVKEVEYATSRVGFGLPLSSTGPRDLRIPLRGKTLERTVARIWTVS
jgi:hypothetical protein